MDITARKQAVRVRMRQLLQSLDEKQQRLAADRVEEEMLRLQENKKWQHWSVYLSHGDEVGTHALIKALIARGCQVFVPVWDSESMWHVSLDDVNVSLDALFVLGLLERNGQLQTVPVYTGVLDVVIVPGLAFDRVGNRVGTGYGYYDRWLVRYTQEHAIPKLVGVCHACQLVDTLPCEEHDWLMDEVVVG